MYLMTDVFRVTTHGGADHRIYSLINGEVQCWTNIATDRGASTLVFWLERPSESRVNLRNDPVMVLEDYYG